MCKRVCAICQVVYLLIYSFLFPLRRHYWLFILLDCLRFEAPTWFAVASWLLITLTRVKEIDHKEFRKVIVIKWLVLQSVCSESVWKTGAVKGRNVIKTCESEGWGHGCHEGNRTNSLLCLTTGSTVFFSSIVFSPSILEPVCFDSALYLYFKWLNYMESCSENYGCFPLFLSAGT